MICLCAHESNIKIFYVLPTYFAYVFCMNLSTNRDFFPFNIKWFPAITELEFDTTQYDITQFVTTQFDTTQFDTTQFDTTQFDTTQFDTTQFEMNP
jgi:hypothetical protein